MELGNMQPRLLKKVADVIAVLFYVNFEISWGSGMPLTVKG